MSELITVTTAELTGLALDWAVAEAVGAPLSAVTKGYVTGRGKPAGKYSPSTDWAQGGELIHRFKIAFVNDDRECTSWTAVAFSDGDTFDNCYKAFGPDHLVAACRAVVAAKLGDTALIPSELLQGSATR